MKHASPDKEASDTPVIERRSVLLGAIGMVSAAQWAEASPPASSTPIATGSAQLSELAGGPYRKLVIKNARVIPGNGGTSTGPWDIVIEKNVITQMTSAQAQGPGADVAGERVIDATGMYVMPGIIDMHTHVRTDPLPLEYVYYLKLAHGVTTICHHPDRELESALEQARLSATNAMLAPRIFPLWPWESITGYSSRELEDPARAMHITADIAKRGMRIVSLDQWTWDQDLFGAICRAVKAVGGITTVHLQPRNNAVINAVDAARLGVSMIEHHYGYAESALEGRGQDFPRDYNYMNESMRFRLAGKVWTETNRGKLLTEVVQKLVDSGVTMLPTRVVYEASRDVLRAQSLPWHQKYTHQFLMSHSEPGGGHAAFHYDWTSDDEAYWSRAFELWGDLIFEFNNRGGNVVYGTDDPWMWATSGFSNVRELQLMRETGVHTLEVLKFATRNSALRLGEPRLGLVRPGYLADLMIVDGDPSYNLQNLYSFGAITIDGATPVEVVRGNSGGAPEAMRRTRGVVHTIKDGIVTENAKLMREVARMVAQSKQGAKPTLLTEPFRVEGVG